MARNIRTVNELHDRADIGDFDAIYEQTAERVLNLAFRMTGNEETARDLTQEIYVKVFRSLDSFEGKSNVYTWIHRIALNHIYNYLKKEKRHRWLDLLDSDVLEAFQSADDDAAGRIRTDADPADRVLEAGERAQLVWKAITSLPPKYRAPLVLFYYENMSYKEIAESLGISLSAVEARIHRARKKLVKLLGPWVDRV